jgi:signal transduction histidine kinase
VKLALAVTVAVAALGAVFATASYAWLRIEIEDEVEAFAVHEIDEVANVIASAASLDDPTVHETIARLLTEEGVLALEAWSLDGERVFPAPGPGETPAALPPDRIAAARTRGPIFEGVRTDTGQAGLRATRQVDFGREPRWLVAATVSRESADEALAGFGRSSAVGVVAASLLIGAASLAVLSRALRPVQDLVADAVILAQEGGGARLREPPRGSELAELAGLLNRLLAQTEASLARLRRFTADAGHELRTPLTRIRAELDAALAATDLAAARESLASVLEELDVLRQVIDGLLELAQGEEPALDTQLPVDIAELVAEVVGEASVVCAERRVEIELEPPPRAVARGSRALLGRVLWNLIDNAVHATARGGHVRVRVAPLAGGRIGIEVEDDGPGIDPGVNPETLFEPFVRARGGPRPDPGLGLGLALSRAIARRHAGDLVWLTPGSLPGARLRLVLPVAGPPPGVQPA